MQTPEERQYITRHQSDIDALLADLSQRALLSNSVREEWKTAVQSALTLRNQLRGMRAFRTEGMYKAKLVDMEYAVTRFIRLAGHDGSSFDGGHTNGYEAVVELQETIANEIDRVLEIDQALIAHSSLSTAIRTNSAETRRAHSL